MPVIQVWRQILCVCVVCVCSLDFAHSTNDIVWWLHTSLLPDHKGYDRVGRHGKSHCFTFHFKWFTLHSFMHSRSRVIGNCCHQHQQQCSHLLLLLQLSPWWLMMGNYVQLGSIYQDHVLLLLVWLPLERLHARSILNPNFNTNRLGCGVIAIVK